ncbi:2910_t:CDS:2, partial [Racocetra persica]
IQPGQWRDKGEKIYGPVTDIVYWPKNRHYESIKDIPDSTAPSIHDPITRYQNSYLNGEGGSGKTTHGIQVYQNNSIGEWTPERMGEKKFPQVVIWDKIICCRDDAQPLPFFGEMPHNWLKERTNYYKEVSTDYRAKCPKLRELKKSMCRKNNRIQSKLFREILPTIEKWEHGHKQNCLVEIPGSFDKQELVKNDIVHLLLNTLPKKFLADILMEKKILDWDLGYAMTVHTSQGITLEALQRVWIIDEHLAWDNLIYLAVDRPPLPPEIEKAKNKKAIERSLRPFISGKLVGYMDQDKKKDCEFNLSDWDDAGDLDQWTADRIDNKLGHIKGNVRLTCLEYMVKQDNDSVIDFYMKIKASTSDSEKQVREIFINRLSPENYLEAEKFESGILLNELVGRLWVLESERKAKYIKLKAEVINIIKNTFENGAEDLKKLKTEQPEFYDFYFKI